MSHAIRALAVGLLACAALLAPARPAAAQDKSDQVKITTVDGVELHGVFYQSPKKNAPAVICLHAVGAGETGTKKGWTFLAEALQPNYSVMLFDFRGHGKSVEIQPEVFWNVPFNRANVKGTPKKATIDYKDFNKQTYYTALVNDIAAVKAFLDRKNDLGVCNTSNTIIIGAESGATLGAIWLNSQWALHKLVGNAMLGFPQPANNPEGKDVIACIWLSPSSKLGATDVSLTKTLELPAKGYGTPMVFMYGDQDTKATDLAKALEKNLKPSKEAKYKYTAAVGLKGTKLAGEKLLQKALNTDTAIKEYLDSVVDDKGNEWGEREFRKTSYVWKLGGQYVPAKNPADNMNLVFDTYTRFRR